MKIKDRHKISQLAVDDIVHHSQGLVDDVVARIKVGVQSKLAGAVFMETLLDLMMFLRDPFNGINTCHKQENYFRTSLGLIVSSAWDWHVQHI